MLGKGADSQVNSGEVQAFARTELAPDSDDAFDLVARHLLDHELHETVVEKEPVPRFHHARQGLEAHRDALLITDDLFVREDETIARNEIDRLRRDLANAHFRPGEIGHDGDAAPRFLCRLANARNDFGVSREISRAMLSPARISRTSISGESEAGPIVATILVF